MKILPSTRGEGSQSDYTTLGLRPIALYNIDLKNGKDQDRYLMD